MTLAIPSKLNYKVFFLSVVVFLSLPSDASAVQYFVGPQLCSGQNVGQYSYVSIEGNPCTSTSSLSYNWLYFDSSSIPNMGSASSEMRYGDLSSSTLLASITLSSSTPMGRYNEKKFVGESVGNSDTFCQANPSNSGCLFYRVGNYFHIVTSGPYTGDYYSWQVISTSTNPVTWGLNGTGQYLISTTSPTTTETATTPSNKNIRIIEPTQNETVATSTYRVEVYFNSGLVFLDSRPTTTRHFEIVDAVTGELQYSYDVLLEANAQESATFNDFVTTPIGSKFIRAMYLDEQGNVYSEVDEKFFNVATNTYLMATGLSSPDQSPGTLTQIDCGLFEFGCQIQKALTFLFIPPENALDKFTNLWQTIAEKKPFGYFTVTINQLKSLDSTGATAFSLGTVPFMDTIFTPFRTLIASILWALFAIYFYKRRLIHLDI